MTKPDMLKLPGLAPLALSQVLYLQGAGNYTIVHLLTGRRYFPASGKVIGEISHQRAKKVCL
ncbi:hypothetical protein [Spirosoma koreense]